MRNILTTWFRAAACIFISISAIGCGFVGPLQRPGPHVIVGVAGAKVLACTPSQNSGDSIGQAHAGDTIASLAFRRNRDIITGRLQGIYLIPFDRGGIRDSGFVQWPQVLEEWEAQPTDFSIPAAADKDAWARANYYVNSHASVKIQVSNEFLLETYNPIDGKGHGFSINRFPHGDKVDYHVTASGDEPTDDALRCAHFIVYGQ